MVSICILLTETAVIPLILSTVGDRDFDGILDFLRNTVPQEAEEVKQSLQVFNEGHQAIQLELEIAQGAVLGVRPDIASEAEILWNCRKVKLELVHVRG
jgi:hypothetical protein